MALKLDFGKLPWHTQIGAFAVLALASVGAFWYFYASPAEQKLVTKRAEVKTLQGDIMAGLATAKRLPEFRREVTVLEAQLGQLQSVLPEEQDVADLLRRVQAMATQSNLTIRGFTPAPITKRETHAEWPIVLKLEGNYHDLGAFLERVSKFPRIINVGTMHIAARQSQSPSATVTAECTAMTFVLVKDAPVEDAKGKKKGKAAKGKAAQMAIPAAALGE
jgi:type IV pilus assembly protein PilO